MALVLYLDVPSLLEHILSFGHHRIIQLYVTFFPSPLGNQLFLWGTLAKTESGVWELGENAL